jgi:hypothetical protein
MEKKYENLRQKTVFDFCDDPKIIGAVFDGFAPDDKAFLIELCKRRPIEQARSLVYFAEIVKNKELQTAIEEEFDEELKEYRASFNE